MSMRGSRASIACNDCRRLKIKVWSPSNRPLGLMFWTSVHKRVACNRCHEKDLVCMYTSLAESTKVPRLYGSSSSPDSSTNVRPDYLGPSLALNCPILLTSAAPIRLVFSYCQGDIFIITKWQSIPVFLCSLLSAASFRHDIPKHLWMATHPIYAKQQIRWPGHRWCCPYIPLCPGPSLQLIPEQYCIWSCDDSHFHQLLQLKSFLPWQCVNS